MTQFTYEIWDDKFHGMSDTAEVVYANKDIQKVINVLRVLGEVYGLKRYSIRTVENESENG